MDSNTQRLVMGAAGVASGPSLYVEDVFSTWLYTGNGSTQTITNGIDLSGKGGLVWTKTRSGAGAAHALFDTARGSNKYILSNTADQEFSISNLLSFTASGFTLGTSTVFNNENSTSYASWSFRKAARFFDIVTYTGSGGNRTIAHNLGSTPGCILIKRLDNSGDWQVYHRSLANTEYLVLNSTAAKATGATRWNSTTPTSSEFSLGTDASVNASGGTYVAYLFAHNAGGFGDSGNDSIVSCGSYTGNGSATGPVINLGWEPQWLLVKRASLLGVGWALIDNMRGFVSGSGNDALLQPNNSNAEVSANFVTPLATGFQPEVSGGDFNSSGETYIYIAIRRGPMKTPTDATKVFSISQAVGTPRYQAAFPPDLIIQTSKSYAFNQPFSRITGTRYMTTTATTSEASFTGWTWDYMNGTGNSFTDSNYLAWMFRRAPGFFDVVAYTGTGSTRTVAHNLGVAPELMIIKNRSSALNWNAYAAPLGPTKVLQPNKIDAAAALTFWNDTAPTSTEFTVGFWNPVNQSGNNIIAYLFASCPGVSKVGSYTGTGTTLNVNCGFTAGARFVLIKRTDAEGDWYAWDTARGIIAANDPYLLLNSTAAEVTNTDYIDPLAAGFQISSTAPAAINASGGSYIYLAIA